MPRKTNSNAKQTQNQSKTAFDTKNYEKNGLTEDEVLEIKEAFDLFDTLLSIIFSLNKSGFSLILLSFI